MLKLGFKISFGLQHRVFCIPWVTRNSVTLCLESRDYSSSAPIRYIPKNPRHINENAASIPFNDSEKDEFASRPDPSSSGREVRGNVRGGRRSIFLDLKKQSQTGKQRNSFLDNAKQELEDVNYEYGFADSESIIEPREVVDEIRLDTEDESFKGGITTTQIGKAMQDAENMAVQFLASRAYTAVELRKKLIGKRFSPNIVEGVIKNFSLRGLINDGLYAESFSRSRWASSTWGPRRIKQALYKKGISETHAEKAVKLVFEDGESKDGNQESRLGLSKQAMDQLYVQASKQWFRGQDASKETRKSRIIRWLQYRGFDWGVTSFILKKLESDCR